MFKMTCVEGEDLTKLCKGIIRPVKCPECYNNGTVYWDSETGEGMCNNPSYINPDRLDWGNCDICDGVGYLFVQD